MVDAMVIVCAVVAAGASLFVVLRADVVHGALALIVVFLSLAGIYAGLGAHFIAAIQVVVYAGAVMVLFLFAIMVLRSRRETPVSGTPMRLHRAGAYVAGISMFVALAGAARWRAFQDESIHANPPSLSDLAGLLFGEYLLSFELVGLLLFVALVAVVILARREPESS